MHPMLVDPALAELPYGVWCEPDPTLVSVAYAAPIPLDTCVAPRPCPPWVKCGACRGVGTINFDWPTAARRLECPCCLGTGTLNAVTGEPL